MSALEGEAPVEGSDLRSKKEKLIYDFKTLENEVKDMAFEDVIEDLGKRTKEYIYFRKMQCQGEFSTLVIDSDGQRVAKEKKLSKVEQKLCMLELINFQRRYSNVIFDLRKKLLLKNHKSQLDLLEKYRQENIDELEKMAAKYR